jgi:16S rRNA (cytosine967-C5)-methyltransferase
MKTPDSRKEALDLLFRWFKTDHYIDHIINESKGNLSQQDRRFRDALVHRTLQWQRQTGAIIDKQYKQNKKPPLHIRILLLMGATEILHMSGTKDHGTVHAVVSLAGHHRAFVNAILRKIIQFRDNGSFSGFCNDKSIKPGIRFSFPDWLTDRWSIQFGDETETLLETLNQPPTRMIRLMTDKNRDLFLKDLNESGNYAGINPWRNDFVFVHSIQSILESDYFIKGHITVQDVSATLPEYFFPEKGVLTACDVCSAPGGKSAALLKHLPPESIVRAYDSDKERLKQTKDTLVRLNHTRFELEEADARTFIYPQSDLFLVDAPCSGFGVIRKRSDLRWRRKPEEIDELRDLQFDILSNVSRFVKPAGRIIYSTCTFDRDENFGTLSSFLDEHSDFELDVQPVHAPDAWKDPALPVLRTLPHRHNCEGSFAACLKRK